MNDDNVLAEVARRVDTDAVAREMIDVFRSEIEAYRHVPEGGLPEIAEANRHNLRSFYRVLVSGTAPTDDELTLVRHTARRWAHLGRPLEDILRGYRLGAQCAWDALIAAASAEEHSRLLPLVGRVMTYVDHVSAAVSGAYHEEQRHAAAEEERRIDRLFERIVGGGELEPEAAATAERLGFPIADRYVPFGIELPEPRPHAATRSAAALRRQGVLAVARGDGVAGVAPADGDPAELDGPGWLVARAEPVERACLRDALDDLRLVLVVARGRGMTGTIGPESCFPELLLARAPDVAEAVRRRVLGPLEEYAARRSSELVETLVAFVDCDLDRRSAAEHLGIHRNTLDYRLRRIEQLNGLTLSCPNDLLVSVLALKAGALESRAPGAAGAPAPA